MVQKADENGGTESVDSGENRVNVARDENMIDEQDDFICREVSQVN